MRWTVRAVLLTAILTQLTGCVAAVLPIVAAATVARSRLKKAGSVPLRAARPTTATDQSVTLTTLAVLPPPDGASASRDPLTAFTSFALAQHGLVQSAIPRASVVLAPDSTLEQPTAIPCDDRPTAVIIDVDLVGAVTGLERAASTLRDGGIQLLWTADNAATASELDNGAASAFHPASDRLLAVDASSSRKQLARQYAALDHCIVAIAGARRGDMDELYDYLKVDTAAHRIDVLWGAGWFLIPKGSETNALDP